MNNPNYLKLLYNLNESPVLEREYRFRESLFGISARSESVVMETLSLHLFHVFAELSRAQNRTLLNPSICPASERASRAARKWVVSMHNRYPTLRAHILVPGDGSIVVKWQNGNDFVSADFDESDSEMDTLFYKLNNLTESEDFNALKLEDLIARLWATEAVLVQPSRTFRQTGTADTSGSSSTDCYSVPSYFRKQLGY